MNVMLVTPRLERQVELRPSQCNVRLSEALVVMEEKEVAKVAI
jgi:hypothetical protein